MAAFLLVVTGAYSLATVSRNSVWQNDLTLWTDAARKAPEHPRPYSSIGDHYVRVRQLDEAIEVYRFALGKSPADVGLLNKLGIAHANKGQLEEARTFFLKAARLVPDDPKQHFNLGQVYASLKRYDESIEEFRTALRLRPDYERAAKAAL
jgi:tetratricopeptide (TPR) repeat protein